MPLSKSPELNQFFSTYFADAAADADASSVQSFLSASTPITQARISEQAQALLTSVNLVEDLGMSANRWFSSFTEAQEWLQNILHQLSQSTGSSDAPVKDSNGALLKEGDSVTVIKDLKVKGGSSDLKRGTLIKKIHLIGDAGAIECTVDGSTLVLKTIFLKKA